MPNPCHRVLYLIDSLRAGGKERQAVTLLRSVVEQGKAEFLVVVMGNDLFFEPAIRSAGIRVEVVKRMVRWDPCVFLQLLRLARKLRPTVVHTTCWMTTFYGLPLARILGAGVVNGSIRNAFDRKTLRWKAERCLLTASDVRVANSLAGLASRGLDPHDAQNLVVYNGFDFNRLLNVCYRRIELPHDYQGRLLVAMVAQFKDDKDYATFIRAAKQVSRIRTDVGFVAVGDGKNLSRLRTYAEAEAAPVYFTGKLPEVEAILEHISIGTLATFTEGLSNSIMEYMAFRLPVVVTNGGGSAELVEDGVTGFLVPPRDPEALAEKLLLLLECETLRNKMGCAGRRRLELQCSLDKLCSGMLEAYDLAGPKNARPSST